MNLVQYSPLNQIPDSSFILFMLLWAHRCSQWFKTLTWENGRGRKDSKFRFQALMEKTRSYCQLLQMHEESSLTEVIHHKLPSAGN